jgi:hypothetical protein
LSQTGTEGKRKNNNNKKNPTGLEILRKNLKK